ncbi:MAG: hypothetical protein UT63_C0003G0039 [Candidatus Gottesmanbacteria bacterium GW2011_GWC2_39_8]|uniref:Integral membrane protein n=1 Tax=Candidatus Gottesmanbacteria bacterium GW2011_GWC2_39_8 TaxID=1618450 RepID=A0A0G0Q2H6_9BACT|nr:MAG: hypothetical protein UT63_C0003G0039 [Candidatus Gottesmanbacteria bacterium GW2011_GWC2_39_8]
MIKKIIFILYPLVLVFLSVYTFSQVDLNLTLSSNPFFQNFQKALIYLGYYQRPLSSVIFLLILLMLFLIYAFILRLSQKGKISGRDFILLVIISVAILIFSYPAFSYDIFNYIFDARIVTHYGLNPYQYKALDFPSDTWIRFMHWTHRYYPYGPVWLILTLPSSFFGMGKFIWTLLNFKLLFSLFYLGNIFLLDKILKHTGVKNRVYNLSLFAFNPLIITETLVSPHNESMMLFFLLLSIYFLLSKKKPFSYLALLFSIGIKYITAVFIPVYIYFAVTRKSSISLKNYLPLFFWSLLVSIIPLFYLREPYPWYFVTLLGMFVLVPDLVLVFLLSLGVTIGSLLRYLPFIYFGDYQYLVIFLEGILFTLPVLLAITIYLLLFRKASLNRIWKFPFILLKLK